MMKSEMQRLEVGSDVAIRRVYSVRWYMLTLFCLVSAAQNAIWNTWGPIAASAEKSFGWNDGMIALMSNWGPITFVFSTPFLTWLMDTKGMRVAMLFSSLLLTLGTGLRCIPAAPATKTMLIHAGQLLNGIPGPLVMAGAPLVSAVWFPVRQRTTATAIGAVGGGFGMALSFIIGPYLVKDVPDEDPEKHLTQESRDKGLIEMRGEIENYLYITFLGCVALLAAVFFTFQEKPPTPPSVTASTDRLDYITGICSLIRNEKFWTLAAVYGLSLGIYFCYMPVLEVLLKSKGITQEESGMLGFYSSLVGNITPLLVARFADAFKRKMKMCIITLYMGASISFAVFTLAYQGWFFIFTKDLMYMSQTVGAVCLLAGVPLIVELSCEASYPVAEGVTTGLVAWLSNLSGLIFLLILMIPDIGTSWMNWCLTGSICICIPILMLYRERFSRPD